jgi:DNA ligase-1
MSIFKPMLATDADLGKLRFPLLASPKLDGIRAIVRDGVVYSRSNKPIPNKFVQEKFKHLNTLDGELIVGHPNSHDVYRQTTSHVMSHDKTDFPVTFYVFDCIRDLGANYGVRYRWLEEASLNTYAHVNLHEQVLVQTIDQLIDYENQCLDDGYEGLILRDPNAPYKMGRSTVKEGYLLKMKRFVDAEFEIVGFEERMHNGNEATTSELGRTKRSSHKAGKSGRGDLGAIVLRHKDGFNFNCGTGFTDEERDHIWRNQSAYLGALAKIKYFAVGMKDAPRHPVWLGLRDRRDT